jgi:ribosomal-protein-alanine N-acetyltransferase
MATTEERLPLGLEGDDDSAGGNRIRDATVEDVVAVAAIEAASFANPWHPHTFRSLIEKGRAFVPVAEDPEEGVIGYAVFWWVMDQGELANVAVRPDFQGRGIGSALLDRVMVHAREKGVETLFLEVRYSNETAHQLYLSRGFSQVAIRKGYYQKPKEDARILVKRLGGEGE